MLDILIVDDEESICDTLSWSLKKEGHHVTCLKNFQDAKATIERSEFDIYIIDIFLPEKNGIELIKLIKKLNQNGIIIVISGYPNVPTLVDAIRLDAYDYIKKPFTFDYLKQVIDQIILLQDELIGVKMRDAIYSNNKT
ncbi:MAG: response regulator [Candidatus Helarchaeota archaeon]